MADSVSPVSLPALLEKQTKCCLEQCGLRQRPLAPTIQRFVAWTRSEGGSQWEGAF